MKPTPSDHLWARETCLAVLLIFGVRALHAQNCGYSTAITYEEIWVTQDTCWQVQLRKTEEYPPPDTFINIILEVRQDGIANIPWRVVTGDSILWKYKAVIAYYDSLATLTARKKGIAP